MIRNLTLLSLFSLLVASCGGGDGETLSYARGELQCTINNVSIPFPGGTTCRGLDVSPSDLITPQREYWHCRSSEGETREYFFSDGTGRVEVVRGAGALSDGNTGDFAGAVFNFRWSLNTETCSLWGRFDQSLCGVSVESQITNISADSITTETATDPDNLSNISSETCQRRRATSSESPDGVEKAVEAEISDHDDTDASGGGVLPLAREILSGSLRAE